MSPKNTILSVSFVCWTCFTFVFLVLSYFSVSWFDVFEKNVVLLSNKLVRDIFCFFSFLSCFFLLFCSLFFFFLKMWNNLFHFWTVFLKFLVNPFPPSIFSNAKISFKTFHFCFSIFFCFTFFLQHFPFILSSFFFDNFYPFIFLFIPFVLLSPFSLLSFSFSLSFSLSHVSLHCFFSIAVFAYPLFVLTHFSSLYFDLDLIYPVLLLLYFFHLRIFSPEKINIFCGQLLKMKCLFLLTTPSSVFDLLFFPRCVVLIPGLFHVFTDFERVMKLLFLNFYLSIFFLGLFENLSFCFWTKISKNIIDSFFNFDFWTSPYFLDFDQVLLLICFFMHDLQKHFLLFSMSFEYCQDDSVICSCFRKDKNDNSRPVWSMCVNESGMSIVQLSCICL